MFTRDRFAEMQIGGILIQRNDRVSNSVIIGVETFVIHNNETIDYLAIAEYSLN